MNKDVIETLENLKSKMNYYQSDIAIDIQLHIDNPMVPFIHATHDNGTYMTLLDDIEWYPADRIMVPYLFGSADRYHILNGKKICAEYPTKIHNCIYHYFDGHEISNISKEKYLTLIKDYHYLMTLKFDNERRKKPA